MVREAPELPAGYEDVPFEAVRFRARRRAIARNLEESSRIPSLTADMQVDLERLLAARARWNGERPERRLTVLAFLARAAVDTLAEFPTMNASYTEAAVLRWEPVNLGIAVDSPGGLVVPVVRDAARLGVAELGAEVARLAGLAREGGLVVGDLGAGTFTISNPGSVGPVLRAEALLNPPQVALLGFPAAKRVPVVVDRADRPEVEVRTVVCPSLTFDHRVLDGGEVIRFLDAFRSRVETWDLDHYETPADGAAAADLRATELMGAP